MTTPFLVGDVKLDEGLRLTAYPDPISKGDPWTIGYGHTGPDVQEGTVWTQEMADRHLALDLQHAANLCQENLVFWPALDAVRQDVLVNMMFNMGWLSHDGHHGLGTFNGTLGLIGAGDYAGAAQHMESTAWASQVGGRAKRLAEQMRTGVRVPRRSDPPMPKPTHPVVVAAPVAVACAAPVALAATHYPVLWPVVLAVLAALTVVSLTGLAIALYRNLTMSSSATFTAALTALVDAFQAHEAKAVADATQAANDNVAQLTAQVTDLQGQLTTAEGAAAQVDADDTAAVIAANPTPSTVVEPAPEPAPAG